jgi:hypothetical protein
VIVHHYFKGHIYAGTAELLGLGIDTVRSRLQKARSRIKKEMRNMDTLEKSSQTIQLDREEVDMLRCAAGFASKDPDRPALGGLFFDRAGRIVATDGFRLYLWTSERFKAIKEPVLSGPWPVDIPDAAKAIMCIKEEAVELSVPGLSTQVAPVIPLDFPDYERVIPEK